MFRASSTIPLSRQFRSATIPTWRSTMVALTHPKLQFSPISLNKSFRNFSSSFFRNDEASSEPKFTPILSLPPAKMQITFTCTANLTSSPDEAEPEQCLHRSTHTFSKVSYTSGVVLIQCPNCLNRHLIADHLGYFKNVKPGAMGMDKSEKEYGNRTVEDLMEEKGETVLRGIISEVEGERWIEISKPDGTIEYLKEDDLKK